MSGRSFYRPITATSSLDRVVLTGVSLPKRSFIDISVNQFSSIMAERFVIFIDVSVNQFLVSCIKTRNIIFISDFQDREAFRENIVYFVSKRSFYNLERPATLLVLEPSIRFKVIINLKSYHWCNSVSSNLF